MKLKLDVNNILYIIVLLFIILVIIFKSMSLHLKFKETFESGNNDLAELQELEKEVGDIKNNVVEETTEDIEELPEDITKDNMSTEDLREKCKALISGEKKWKSIISKSSGRVIDVEYIRKAKDMELGKNNSTNKESDNSYLYIIKWKPLGNKPGGCITCNANGTYSTPMCDKTIQNQLWHIVYIENRDDLMNIMPENNKNQGKGKDVDNTEYPFYVVLSSYDKTYVLNYEGGGLSIRPIANYDSIRWDVSTDPIQQDPLPTQDNSKYTGLTPQHNISKADTSLNKFFQKAVLNTNDNNNNKKINKDGSVNFNINLDPELLQQLGLGFSGNNSNDNIFDNYNSNNSNSNNSNSNNSNNGLTENTDVSKEADLLLTQEELDRRKVQKNKYGGRGNVSDMVMEGANNDPCNNCGKVPPNYIKKDLVKSMCLGCNNIDDVST